MKKIKLPNKLTTIPDPLKDLLEQSDRKTKAVVSISLVALIIFFLVALAFPFRDQLFKNIFPKLKIKAAVCSSPLNLPEQKYGFVYSGGDLSQATQQLGTDLYFSSNLSWDANQHIYQLGQYANTLEDPLNLKLLMDNHLSNTEFKGLWGQSPNGWNVLTVGRGGTASIETVPEYAVNEGTSLKISNLNSPSGTQVAQTFNQQVAPGSWVVIGVWVKAKDPQAVKVLLQNNNNPFQDFTKSIISAEADKWTYLLGYGQVPEGVNSFQVVLRVVGENQTAWFDGISAAVIDDSPNETLATLVGERCGSAWLIGPKMGSETLNEPIMKKADPIIYALIYHSFYNSIKSYDPTALVMLGGIDSAPAAFNATDYNGYSPKNLLDRWGEAYQQVFKESPPIDGLAINYLASEKEYWQKGSLENYLKEFRSYLDGTLRWKDKPIWISSLAVSQKAGQDAAVFISSSAQFLVNNQLKVERWFWFDSCGRNSLATLFEEKGGNCTWPMKLTNLGNVWATQKALQNTPTTLQISPTTPPAIITSITEASSSPTKQPTVPPTIVLSPTVATSAETSPSATPKEGQ